MGTFLLDVPVHTRLHFSIPHGVSIGGAERFLVVIMDAQIF